MCAKGSWYCPKQIVHVLLLFDGHLPCPPPNACGPMCCVCVFVISTYSWYQNQKLQKSRW